DVISAAAGGAHPWARDMYRAGTFVLMVGTGVLFLAMIAGFIDRARFTAPASRPRRGVNRHAVVMTAVAALCVMEIIVRGDLDAGATSTPAVVVVLSLAGATLLGIGSDLGGRLVYREGVGVRTAHASRSEPEPERESAA
ncbi:MAG: DUF2231 domain-containing protein, partial [Streptosporangiaceae bacterium]